MRVSEGVAMTRIRASAGTGRARSERGVAVGRLGPVRIRLLPSRRRSVGGLVLTNNKFIKECLQYDLHCESQGSSGSMHKSKCTEHNKKE